MLSGHAKITRKREGKLVHLTGLEYSPFKLFALSVLWRAGVSSLKDFEQVSLGPHEIKRTAELLRGSVSGPLENELLRLAWQIGENTQQMEVRVAYPHFIGAPRPRFRPLLNHRSARLVLLI